MSNTTTEKKTVIVKKSFMAPYGEELEAKLRSGAEETISVTFSDNGAFIEAIVEAETGPEPIGNVVGDLSIPKIYTANVAGLGEEEGTFIVEMETSSAAASSGDYADERAAAIARGFTAEEFDERVEYYRSENFPPRLTGLFLKKLSEWGQPGKCPKGPSAGAVYRNLYPEKTSPILIMLVAACTRVALILFGEKSTGKNCASTTVAWLLGLPESIQGLQRDMSIEDFFGGQGTDNSASENLTQDLCSAWLEYESNPGLASEETRSKAEKWLLYTAKNASVQIKRLWGPLYGWALNGGVFHLNELNMGNANIMQMVVNPLADNNKVLVVPGGETIPLHESCVLFGSMNPGYAGSMDLNKATASRFGHVEFLEAPSIAAALKENLPEGCLPERYISACDKLYKDFCATVATSTLSNDCLNIRGFVNALSMVSFCPEELSLQDCIRVGVIDLCDKKERPVLDQMLRDRIVF